MSTGCREGLYAARPPGDGQKGAHEPRGGNAPPDPRRYRVLSAEIPSDPRIQVVPRM